MGGDAYRYVEGGGGALLSAIPFGVRKNSDDKK